MKSLQINFDRNTQASANREVVYAKLRPSVTLNVNQNILPSLPKRKTAQGKPWNEITPTWHNNIHNHFNVNNETKEQQPVLVPNCIVETKSETESSSI